VSAYLLTFAVLVWRYGWRGSLAIVAPPALATLITLSALGWTGQDLSIFNLMALVLLLGVGMDAALFMREGHLKPRQTLVAVSLCGISTVLSFGLLGLSATAAIQSFGITLFLGITCCCLLSPLAMPGSSSRFGGSNQLQEPKQRLREPEQIQEPNQLQEMKTYV
jgi:predicted exporter